jgi:hypothetical protein
MNIPYYATSPNIRIIIFRRIVDLPRHGSAPYGVQVKDTFKGVFFHFISCFGLYVVVKKLTMTRFLGPAVNEYSEFH